MTGRRVDPKTGLLDQQKRFCDEYLVDFDATAAYLRAGYKGKGKAAMAAAARLLTYPAVHGYLAGRQKAVADELGLTAKDVVDRFWSMGTADPRELIELHRGCCRYCYGTEHLYQFTPRELREARSLHAAAVAAAKEGQVIAPLDEGGGIGWDPRRDPNQKCPECFGEGVERVLAKDTRKLSPAARLLYAGVEVTQHGLKIRMHDQTAALVNVGKHLGAFKERVELTGKDGGPVQHSLGDVLAAIDGAETGIGPAASRKG